MARSHQVLPLPTVVAILLAASIAAAPANLPEPAAPAVTPTSAPGELTIAWGAVAGARYYTVGWINKEEYLRMQAGGRDWLDAFHDATVPSGYRSHTVFGFKPGGQYYTIIGARNSRFGGPSPRGQGPKAKGLCQVFASHQ